MVEAPDLEHLQNAINGSLALGPPIRLISCQSVCTFGELQLKRQKI